MASNHIGENIDDAQTDQITEDQLINPNANEYPIEEKDKHRVLFEKQLNDKYDNQSTEEAASNKKIITYIINKTKYDLIKDILCNIK